MEDLRLDPARLPGATAVERFFARLGAPFRSIGRPLYACLNRGLDLLAERAGLLALFAALALALRIITGVWNVGYFAVDDQTLLEHAVPFQVKSAMHDGDLLRMSAVADIRSPLPQAVVNLGALAGYSLGLTAGLDQARVIFAIMGLISMLSVWYAWKFFMLLGRRREAALALLFVGFHYAMPFLSTRTLIENMAAPFILMSLYYLTAYHVRGSQWGLFWSLAILAFASMLRFQAGILILAYLPFIYIRRDMRGFIVAFVGGLFGFAVTGLVDVAFGKAFHESLIKYIDFNLKYASQHGVSPFYAYLATLAAFVLPPAFFSLYRGLGWRANFSALAPTALAFAIFLISHSAVEHKEDRFLVPALPAFLVLLTPLANHLLRRPGRLLILLYFLIINFTLMFFLSFFTFQNNIIGLKRWLEQNPQITHLTVFEESLTYFPFGYADRGALESLRLSSRLQREPLELRSECDHAFIVHDSYRELAAPQTVALEEIVVFKASPLERIMTDLNPSGNRRRMAFRVYMPPTCSSSAESGDGGAR